MTVHSAIQNAIKTNDLLFFVGSGFSRPLGLPNWTGLVELISVELKDDYPGDAFLANLPQMLKQGTFTELEALDKLEKKYRSRILQILEKHIEIDLGPKDLSRHGKLWQVTGQIVTTNYDRALEESTEKKIQVFDYSDNYRLAQMPATERYLFKAHGSITHPDRCVLFSDQYKAIYNPQSGAAIELFSILSNKTIIFIGFSLSDPYVNELLQLRQRAYKQLKQNNFIITTDTSDFSHLGVERIQDVNDYGEQMDRFLDELIVIRKANPPGLGFLIKGLRQEGKDVSDESRIKEAYLEFLDRLENEPESKEIAEEIREGNFEDAEEKLVAEFEEDLAQIKERKEKAASKAFELGRLKNLQLKYKDAFYYFQNAVELQPENALYLNELGLTYQLLGNYSTAIEFYQKALEINLKFLGENHKDTAISYNNIGSACDDLGEHQKAIGYFEKALKIDLEFLGEAHHSTAIDYNNIGLALHHVGKYHKAIEYCEKALKIDLEVLGEAHPSTAIDYNNIGESWRQLGEYHIAIEYYEKALKIDLQVLGEAHPSTAVRYNNIGSAWGNMGEHEKAIEYFEKALKIDLKVLGEAHPSTAIDYNNIGESWRQLGEYHIAIEYYEKALQIDLEVLGEAHPSAAVRYNNIGAAWDDLGEYHKAIEYYEKSLKISLAVLGEAHPSTAVRYNNIGAAWDNLGEHHKAIEYYKKSLAIDLKILGKDHPSTKIIKANLELAQQKAAEREKLDTDLGPKLE